MKSIALPVGATALLYRPNKGQKAFKHFKRTLRLCQDILYLLISFFKKKKWVKNKQIKNAMHV
ncbi:hypothetical protein [Pontibacter akesuensis]|uniref:hypothetical protein n=1 Tax=Pontibacter akesuensis TaxID=388950 RepID=UPI000839F484|nr:hypothetical protein [Pontibacter akesuensis]